LPIREVKFQEVKMDQEDHQQYCSAEPSNRAIKSGARCGARRLENPGKSARGRGDFEQDYGKVVLVRELLPQYRGFQALSH